MPARRGFPVWLCISLLAAAALACNLPAAANGATATPTVTVTPGEALPTSTPESAGQPGRLAADVPRDSLIFITGFEQGWPTIDEPNARISVSGNEYLFEIGPNALRYLTTTVVNAVDMYTQVQATPQDCPSGAGYGLFFRLADASNYYAVTFFCDNRVTVFARSGGSLQAEPLVESALPGSLNVAERVAHVLGILARGSDFTVYFDGQAVATFSSDLHARGDVAIYAVSPPNGVLRVAFDNLEVWTVQ